MAPSSLQLGGVDHAVLRCTDLPAMLHFYIDILGCRCESDELRCGLCMVPRCRSSVMHRPAQAGLPAACLPARPGLPCWPAMARAAVARGFVWLVSVARAARTAVARGLVWLVWLVLPAGSSGWPACHSCHTGVQLRILTIFGV